MAIGKSGEDYLEAILILERRMGYVRAVDLANYMGYSNASISYAVKELKQNGYLVKTEQGLLQLTDEGIKIALQMYERHCFFTKLLEESGIDPEVAEREACEIEHVISENSFRKLQKSYKE